MTSVANAHQRVLTELGGRATKPPTPPAVRNPAAFNSQGRPTPPREQRSRASMIDRYGTAIETSAGLAEVMTKSFTEASRSGGRVAVMSARWNNSYPDSQRFTGNVVSDTQKVDAQRAVVASGGICNPVPVDYSIDTITITIADRPLRDGLPGFDASCGGVQFIPPVTLTSTNAATGIWTEAIDANPGTATKPIMRIDFGDSQEAIVDAIPTRLLIGNMMGRFSPEQVDNVTSTALAQAARVAETFLLSKISTNSTRVSAAQLLGASRDLVGHDRTRDGRLPLPAARWRPASDDGGPACVGEEPCPFRLGPRAGARHERWGSAGGQ